eukprot:SAG25_NODE_1_length_41698_cov_149.842015_7_plen_128_part_00
MHASAYGGHVEVMQLLLRAGAEPGTAAADGRTALCIAVEQGCVAVCRELHTVANCTLSGDTQLGDGQFELHSLSGDDTRDARAQARVDGGAASTGDQCRTLSNRSQERRARSRMPCCDQVYIVVQSY